MVGKQGLAGRIIAYLAGLKGLEKSGRRGGASAAAESQDGDIGRDGDEATEMAPGRCWCCCGGSGICGLVIESGESSDAARRHHRPHPRPAARAPSMLRRSSSSSSCSIHASPTVRPDFGTEIPCSTKFFVSSIETPWQEASIQDENSSSD